MLIKNGLIVNYNEKFIGDIRIQGEYIKEIGKSLLPQKDEEVINAENKIVMPGGIDPHTHFDMPAADTNTSDDFFTGTRAAIAGGTTTIIDFAEANIGSPLSEGLDTWHKKASNKSFCDYSFHMTISDFNNFNNNTSKEILDMINEGITSFKAYTAYTDSIGVSYEDLEKIMVLVKNVDGILCIHAEDNDKLNKLQNELREKNPSDIRNHPLSRPNFVEEIAIHEVIKFAEKIGTQIYIVHISTEEGIKEVAKAKNKNLKIYGETCPHYLLLDDEKYNLDGFESAKYVMSPPLRKQKDIKALWDNIENNIVDTISTDHCSFNFKSQKEIGQNDFTKIPNGIPSVENRLELIHHFGEKRGIPLEKIVELTSYNPAKIFGIYPEKGIIKEGSLADIVIMETTEEYEINHKNLYQNVDYNPYEGIKITKKINSVFLRGQQIVRDRKIINNTPQGKFILRKTKKEEGI